MATILFNTLREKQDQSAYHEEIRAFFQVPWGYGLVASFATWFLLAGFLLCPGAYSAIQKSELIQKSGKAGQLVQETTQKVPVIVMASIICFIALIIIVLIYKRRNEKMWVSRRLFIPVTLNSLMGIFSMLVNTVISTRRSYTPFDYTFISVMVVSSCIGMAAAAYCEFIVMRKQYELTE